MSFLVVFFIASISNWSISRFIRKENGPWCFMPRLKAWSCSTWCRVEPKSWSKFCNDGKPEEGTIAEWLSCNKCACFGIALAQTAVWLTIYLWLEQPPYIPLFVWLNLPFAIRAVAIFMDHLEEILSYEAKLSRKLESELGACNANENEGDSK